MNPADSKSIYTHMQAAVDIVGSSLHHTNKIAATIAGKNFAISKTNQWPQAIIDTIGTTTKIGNASATIHAETACIFAANAQGHATKNASLFITDPPCPNCMKNMAEAGIAKLYIDHKGFDKDWAKRRGDQFEAMSMRVAAKAGMDVFVIYRKEEKFEVISTHAADYKPSIEKPARIETCSDWSKALKAAKSEHEGEPFALALATNANAKNANAKTLSILVDRHPTIGYTYETVESKQDKYSFILQPLNRLLMIAAKEGLTLDSDHIYSSRTPTSRELINFIGAGFSNLHIGNEEKSRDEHGIRALKKLQEHKLLTLF